MKNGYLWGSGRIQEARWSYFQVVDVASTVGQGPLQSALCKYSDFRIICGGYFGILQNELMYSRKESCDVVNHFVCGHQLGPLQTLEGFLGLPAMTRKLDFFMEVLLNITNVCSIESYLALPRGQWLYIVHMLVVHRSFSQEQQY